MEKSKILNGQEFVLFVDQQAVAFGISDSLEIEVATIQTSSKQSAKYTHNIGNGINWTLTSEMLATEDWERLKMVAESFAEIEVAIMKPANWNTYGQQGIADTSGATWTYSTAQPHYKGTGIITSLTLNAPSGDKCTASVVITGNGALT